VRYYETKVLLTKIENKQFYSGSHEKRLKWWGFLTTAEIASALLYRHWRA